MSGVLKLPGGYRRVCGVGGERQTNVTHMTREGENHRGSRGTDVQAPGQAWGPRRLLRKWRLSRELKEVTQIFKIFVAGCWGVGTWNG